MTGDSSPPYWTMWQMQSYLTPYRTMVCDLINIKVCNTFEDFLQFTSFFSETLDYLQWRFLLVTAKNYEYYVKQNLVNIKLFGLVLRHPNMYTLLLRVLSRLITDSWQLWLIFQIEILKKSLLRGFRCF